MHRSHTTSSTRRTARATLLAVAALALVAAAPAAAERPCQRVHAHLFIEADPEPSCGSPILLCATATVHGSLKAVTDFIGTSVKPTTEPPETDVVLLTGDNTFHTAGGDFFTKDLIVLSAGGGQFAEVDVVIGGTGVWKDATGVLTATGTFVDGIGEGIIEGEVCAP